MNRDCDCKGHLICHYSAVYKLFHPDTQGTKVWCPICRLELVKNGNVLLDRRDGTVLFKCSRCTAMSNWDFSPPAPILLENQVLIWKKDIYKIDLPVERSGGNGEYFKGTVSIKNDPIEQIL